MFLSGSTQDSSMVAEVLSSAEGSCWTLRRASCSSVGRMGSGSSLKNCFTKPATSQGRAVGRHSSPASSLAWRNKHIFVVKCSSQRICRRKQGQPWLTLTLSSFRRTTEPDFLNRPSVSACASSFMQVSTRKLQRW